MFITNNDFPPLQIQTLLNYLKGGKRQLELNTNM